VTPELAERLAKLLRLACSTGPDGEKLAAIGRLSAIAAAHDLDWDQTLNGSGPSRDQMQELFNAGYERGLADDRAETQRDWTPDSGTSAEVGSDAERVEAILNAASQANGILTDWERDWCDSLRERFKQYRNRLYVSDKMWAIFDRLEVKMRPAGIL
jgi:hypothetical protein